MLATVRNRRGIISGAKAFDGHDGRVHLVEIEFKDDQKPSSGRLIWELEPQKQVVNPTALPSPSSSDPMPPDDFDALIRSARWDAISPYLDPDGDGPLDRRPISAPFHGAVEVEDYQLVPLLKALRMPRVSLLIADDVGLGKTIEAGLILSELLLRRRVQRALILTPASLRLQWRDEMWEKFSFDFAVVDRDATNRLKRQAGADANPWRAHSRVIASYHYLRQPDVYEQFRAACRTPPNSPHLPWDLLIVDEAHNLMPAPFGEDSDLCRMLRLIAPQFEHRLFLTATPHNGHTRSFSGLLETLDPVRFSQVEELGPAARARIEQVVVRRLKREINARTNPPKFCDRLPPQALMLQFEPTEVALARAFSSFRSRIRSLVAASARSRRRAGWFAVEILGKRLLSCPIAFADSWQRCKEGLSKLEDAEDSEVVAARRSVTEDTSDDRETQSREATASTIVGAWLRPFAGDIEAEIQTLDAAVRGLGLRLDRPPLGDQNPMADARFNQLIALVDRLLRHDNKWRDDERIVVFTEYKTTLDYLVRRLREQFGDDDRVLSLYGGMDDPLRESIKEAFNDADDRVRILVATDAASEGLNLQRTARYMLHYDCPWNPSRLEQRNGRLDRHGQARDVTIHHFVSEDDHDLRFLDHVIRKVDQIREDLGSVGELFDEATHRRLIEGEPLVDVQQTLDLQIEQARDRASFVADDSAVPEDADTLGAADLEAIAAEIDFDGEAMHDTLETAMAISGGRPQLRPSSSNDGRFDLVNPDLQGWRETIDDTLRRRTSTGGRGPLRAIAFTQAPFMEQVGNRFVFNPRPDTVMMSLGHPMLQQALGSLTRRRFPGEQQVSRWTLRLGDVPASADVLILLTVEELAVNALRETFHHWIRTVAFPVQGERLLEPLPHRAAKLLGGGQPTHDEALIERARDVLTDVEPGLRDFLTGLAGSLNTQLRSQLVIDREEARRSEDERYRSRQGEVSKLVEENTLAKLEREVETMKRDRQQGVLAFAAHELEDLNRSIERKREELDRRTHHYEEIRNQLGIERERIVNQVIPRRFTMDGEAQVFPVAVEVRFPANGAEVAS